MTTLHQVAPGVAIPETRPASIPAFYSGLYDKLYRRGYHKDPDYSHAKALCEFAYAELKPRSVLDVGCSLGWSVEFFAKRGIQSCGIDVSETAITKGRRLGRDCRLGSATAIPFADRSIDLIVCTDCLEHMRPEDVDTAVNELTRVADKWLALKINPRRDRNKWWKFVGQSDLHLALMPIDQWISKFKARGFEVLKLDADREEMVLKRA